MDTIEKHGRPVVYLGTEVNADTMIENKGDIFRLISTNNIVIINFSRVMYVNSSGLREIIDIHKQAVAQRKQVYLCNISKDVMELFTFTGLDSVFKIFDNEAAALEA